MKEDKQTAILEAFRDQRIQHDVTFRLNADAVTMLNKCLLSLNKMHSKKTSRASAIRLLIDLYSELKLKENHIPDSEVLSFTTDINEWLNREASNHIALTISEKQRITLRKLEFDIQKIDWAKKIDRNAVVQILLMSYGDLIKNLK